MHIPTQPDMMMARSHSTIPIQLQRVGMLTLCADTSHEKMLLERADRMVALFKF